MIRKATSFGVSAATPATLRISKANVIFIRSARMSSNAAGEWSGLADETARPFGVGALHCGVR